MSDAPDKKHRDAVIALRDKNVIVDAGAGTGKTTLVVARIVEMVAPANDAVPALSLERIAAVTFTRRAAGELKLRLRERLLTALAGDRLSDTRRDRLHAALGALDTAYVGTIHSVADRLLRLRPVEARLSPAYEIAEDVEALVRETFTILLHASEKGTLGAELAGTPAAHLADEAMAIVQDVFEADVLLESIVHADYVRLGLDGVIEGMILHRDVTPANVPPATFDVPAFRRLTSEFLALAPTVDASTRAGRWFIEKAEIARGLLSEEDVRVIVRTMRREFDEKKGQLSDYRRADECGGCAKTYRAAQIWTGKGGAKAPRSVALRKDWLEPTKRWLALRIAALGPVVRALYDRVKSRHRVVDQIDLLLQLRDLLRDNRDVRAQLQGLFDHLFIDEFQDTDPLQAEIALFLCEDGAHASDPWDARLRAGKLTLVGDPKQSIYRFRRADVATYDRVRQKVLERDGHTAPLTANFRSTPGLIGWINDRFANVLGRSPDGSPFDATRGAVFHADLDVGRSGARSADVRVVPIEPAQGLTNAPDVRAAEGRALARYVRWLVEHSDTQILDPLTEVHRHVGYGDIAVLASVTSQLPYLFDAMSAQGVPYASAGGTLFLQDEVHRQFLLGLRALADSDDGVAEAALLRPPFFAIDLVDLAWTLTGKDDERAARGREARALVTELRMHRFDRSPGATARDLLERTAFARTIAHGPNGAQRLQHLRELCLELDTLAAREGVDFDGATALMRAWIDEPIQLEPPQPVDDAAVRVTTVHQAKGLEFPVVILWDARQLWKTFERSAAWTVQRDGRAWALSIEGLSWEEPNGTGLKDRAQELSNEERKRVVYVAATRARDLLILPFAETNKPADYVNAKLEQNAPADLVLREATYRDEQPEQWPVRMEERTLLPIVAAPDAEAIAARWSLAVDEAKRPRFRSIAVSVAAKADLASGDDEPRPPRVRRESRFGATFGTTVHRAIQLVLERKVSVDEAVARAARENNLTERVVEAQDDVTRTIAALRAEGLLEGAFRLEYQVAGTGPDGTLLVGSIDFVAERDGKLALVDFKSDQATALSNVPEYVAQVGAYARLLGGARTALLFTGEGTLRWT